MTDEVVLRRRFAIGDRTFAVLGEPWFDPTSSEWTGRLLFVPLDHSLPQSVATEPVVRADRRDELLRQLGEVTDRALLKAFHATSLPLPRRPRER
jgi:hypothetical protein